MTREKRDRIEEISKAINELRCELLAIRSEEIKQLFSIKGKAKYESSREYIKELRLVADLLSDGIRELGY